MQHVPHKLVWYALHIWYIVVDNKLRDHYLCGGECGSQQLAGGVMLIAEFWECPTVGASIQRRYKASVSRLVLNRRLEY